jgi:ssDNA-specific exonuclease RecJ
MYEKVMYINMNYLANSMGKFHFYSIYFESEKHKGHYFLGNPHMCLVSVHGTQYFPTL